MNVWEVIMNLQATLMKCLEEITVLKDEMFDVKQQLAAQQHTFSKLHEICVAMENSHEGE